MLGAQIVSGALSLKRISERGDMTMSESSHFLIWWCFLFVSANMCFSWWELTPPRGQQLSSGGKKERCDARCWLQITLQIHLNCSIVKIWNLEPRWLVFEERAYFKTQDVPNNIYIWIRRSLSASDWFTVSPGINWQGVTTLWLIAW